MAKKEISYPPARTIEERQNQMINLATNLAEKQLREGTASPLVIAHYLKLGTTNAVQERIRMEEEIKLLKAKTEQLETARKTEEMYEKVIKAFSIYSGNPQ